MKLKITLSILLAMLVVAGVAFLKDVSSGDGIDSADDFDF
jgi:hypothetical protein